MATEGGGQGRSWKSNAKVDPLGRSMVESSFGGNDSVTSV